MKATLATKHGTIYLNTPDRMGLTDWFRLLKLIKLQMKIPVATRLNKPN